MPDILAELFRTHADAQANAQRLLVEAEGLTTTAAQFSVEKQINLAIARSDGAEEMIAERRATRPADMAAKLTIVLDRQRELADGEPLDPEWRMVDSVLADLAALVIPTTTPGVVSVA